MPQYCGRINSKHCAVPAVLNRHSDVAMRYDGKEETLKRFMKRIHLVFIIVMAFSLRKFFTRVKDKRQYTTD
jgi:hypothetical protein